MRTAARFESCYVALLAGLWAEMEAILVQHYAEDAAASDACERVGLRLEALLLEIALLSDKCEFLRWRGRGAWRVADGRALADARARARRGRAVVDVRGRA